MNHAKDIRKKFKTNLNDIKEYQKEEEDEFDLIDPIKEGVLSKLSNN